MRVAKGWPAIVAVLGLAACGGGGYGGGGNGGGGGGGGGGGPPATLTVTKTTPANGATNVARKGSIVITFSTTLDAFSLGLNTVSLTTPAGSPPPFLATAAGNTLTITPIRALPAVVAHRVTVGVGLRGMGGEALSAPIVLDFTTADRQWQTPTRIEPVGPTTAERPRVVVDALGNAFAVWQRRDGLTRSVWANRYVLGTGWGTAAQISVVGSTESSANLPEIAVDASGNATVVWEQSDNGLSSIWSNRYVNGTGWGTATQIQTRTAVTGDAFTPHIAVDALGNALAVWEQFEGGIFEIWSNRYTAGATWGTAVPVETNPGSASSARVAFDETTGRAFAVWRQGSGTCLCVWSSQFTTGAGWSTPKMIANGSAMTAPTPQIAVDGFGSAYAVWTESDDAQHFDVWSNRFTGGGDWGTPVMIDDHGGGSGPPRIVADLNGNAYVVWEQTQANTPGTTIRWNLYKTGAGWGTPGLIASTTDVASGTGGNPDITFDPNGIAHVAWEHDDGVKIHVRSSRLLPSASDWSAAADAHSTDSVAGPQLAVDATGDVTAVWEQNDGAGVAVWSNRFE
jgi:hypothetical protein